MNGTLSCGATKCVNNMSGVCSARIINIMGSNANSSNETQCETYAEKGLKNSITNVLNMNVIGEIKQLFNNESIEMSPRIRCVATNCTHNENNLCAADNIVVTLNSSRTECETFVK